jgi:hypothetical protein
VLISDLWSLGLRDSATHRDQNASRFAALAFPEDPERGSPNYEMPLVERLSSIDKEQAVLLVSS